MLLIEGEAGIGKTRLLMSLIETPRASGLAVFHGEAHPLERTRPFGALVEALDLRSGSNDPRPWGERGELGCRASRFAALLPPDHPERDGVLLELVVALLRTGQVAQAAKITEDVLARPHDADVDLPLRIAMIDALSILNRGQELIDLTESTLTENPDMPLADQALIMAQGSFGRTFSGDYAGGELTARRALALAERAGDPAMGWSCATAI